MQIQIKNLLLEGYSPEVIVGEIVENDRRGTQYEKGTPLGYINRPILNSGIRMVRKSRDIDRKLGNWLQENPHQQSKSLTAKDVHGNANSFDNEARIMSQTGREKVDYSNTGYGSGTATQQQPRLYSSKPTNSKNN